jgi:nitrite reductase/ring-hydroxylating ferredoxin subunit
MIRKGEMVRCPWHGWEFDIRTGQSWCEPAKVRARAYPTEIAAGAEVVKGPYVAETVLVTVEEQYVVVEFQAIRLRSGTT